MILLVLTLLVFPAFPGAPRLTHQVAAAETSPLVATIDAGALPVTLEWGQATELKLNIRNTSGSASYTPRLYEAQPESPVLQRAAPPQRQQVALPAQQSRVDAQIMDDIAASSDAQTEFLVFLAEQPDLAAAYAIDDWAARGAYVEQTLRTAAQQTQQPLREWLDRRGLEYQPFWIVNALAVRGSSDDVAALAGRADVAMLRANYPTSLALEPQSMIGDYRALLPEPMAPQRQGINNVSSNIEQVGANRVWQEFGIVGQGITVANIDSGVRFEHPALLEQYRGYQKDGTYRHAYNWFDPDGVLFEPQDTMRPGHGTHVMGTMVGRGGVDASYAGFGMAPGAAWMAGLGCRNGACWESDLIAVAQWMLAPTDPDGNNPRPDLRPHIINNSWSGRGSDDFYSAYTTAWRAAGIFPVFAAGNYRTDTCGTVGAPGNYSGVVGVGSVNSRDRVSYFSGTGPGMDNNLKPDLMAPGESIYSTYATTDYGTSQGTSMAAPHVAGAVALLWSANPTLIGDYEATYQLLTRTAVPQTDPNFSSGSFRDCHADEVPNNVYGYGRLDTYALIEEARVDIPWLQLPSSVPSVGPGQARTVPLTVNAQYVPEPGAYQARVLVSTGDLSQTPAIVNIDLNVTAASSTTEVLVSVSDELTGTPLTGHLMVDNLMRLPLAGTGASTRLTLPVRSEPYSIATDVLGYVDQQTELVLDSAGTVPLDFTLALDISWLSIESVSSTQGTTTDLIAPTLEFGQRRTYTIDVTNSGTQQLNYRARVPADVYGVWSSTEPDGPVYEWIDLTTTPGAQQLNLGDDEASQLLTPDAPIIFYYRTFDRVYVSANGIITFQPVATEEPFIAGCVPIPETIGTAVVPFRADLNPAAGGSIWAGDTPQGFVVSFEHVVVKTEPSEPETHVTFQVVFRPDGRIQFVYRDIGTPPADVGVGVQYTQSTAQAISCGTDTRVASGTTLELRPQLEPRQWASIPDSEAILSLEPGKSRTMDIVLEWKYSMLPYPYRGRVMLENIDTRQPPVELPIQMTSLPPPHRVLFPVVFHQAPMR